MRANSDERGTSMSRRSVVGIMAGVCVMSLSFWYLQSANQSEPRSPGNEKKDTGNPSGSVDYNRDILPILSSKCFTCHGPDNPKPKSAPLRLDLREIAAKPRKSGDEPIVPGKASDSEVVRRIYLDEGSERMPPIKGGKPLTDAEKALIKR